jgi:hypothetical protein
MPKFLNEILSTGELAQAANIGLPLLNKWQRLRWVSPDQKSGKDARWSIRQAWGINSAERLRKAGFPATVIRQTLSFFGSRTTEQIETALKRGHTELVVTETTAGMLTRPHVTKIQRDPRSRVALFGALDFGDVVKDVELTLELIVSRRMAVVN